MNVIKIRITEHYLWMHRFKKKKKKKYFEKFTKDN